MLIAVLDLCSPKFRLLCGRTAELGGLELLVDVREYVHVGNPDSLDRVEWERAESVVEKLIDRAKAVGVDALFAAARGRLCTVRNGDPFLRSLERQFDVKVSRIEVEDEAVAAFQAVRCERPAAGERLLVVHVGCETVEFAIGVDSPSDLLVSLPLGPRSIRDAIGPEVESELIGPRELQTILRRAFAAAISRVKDFGVGDVVFVGDGARALRAELVAQRSSPNTERLDIRLLSSIASKGLCRARASNERVTGYSALLAHVIASELQRSEVCFGGRDFGEGLLLTKASGKGGLIKYRPARLTRLMRAAV